MNFDKLPEPLDDDKPRRPAPVRWLIAGAVMILAGAAGWWQWHGQAETRHEQRRQATAKAGDIRAKMAELSEKLALVPNEQLNARLELLGELATLADDLQRVSAGRSGAEITELQQWRVRLDEARAGADTVRSRELEEQAAAQTRAGNQAAAIVALREAWELQRRVNRSAVNPTNKNIARESRLEQEVVGQEVAPLQAEVDRASVAAQAAAEARQWEQARAHYAAELEARRRISRDFPKSAYSDVSAIERLQDTLASIDAESLRAKIESERVAARNAAQAGDVPAALARVDEAERLQRELNEKHARSRHASLQQLDDLATERQSIEAAPVWREVSDYDARAAAHLRRREILQATGLIRRAGEVLDKVTARWPRARGLDEDIRQRIGYLRLRAADLAALQDRAYEQLLSLPGDVQLAMGRQEISQEFFSAVMGGNPSRNVGRALPVDSLTLAEAREFCRRLGWVMGVVVRLPREAESRAALGLLRPARLDEEAWHAGNSAGRSQPGAGRRPNLAGFHDLLGNLAEWQEAAGDEAAPVFGGSYLSSRDQFAQSLLRTQPAAQRAPDTGLRIVVEINLTTAPASGR